MNTGCASRAPEPQSRQQIEDSLRENVEQAIADLKAAATQAEKIIFAERLKKACSALNALILGGKIADGIS